MSLPWIDDYTPPDFFGPADPVSPASGIADYLGGDPDALNYQNIGLLTAEQVEQYTGIPGLTSYILDTLNSLPGSYRWTFLQDAAQYTQDRLDDFAYQLAGRYAEFRERKQYWAEGGWFDQIAIGFLGYAAGWLTGYAGTWLGGKVAAWIGGFKGAVWGIASGAAATYGVRYVSRAAMLNSGAAPVTMWAFDVGLVVGAAGLKPHQPLKTAAKGVGLEMQVQVGYNPNWLSELYDDAVDVMTGPSLMDRIGVTYNPNWIADMFEPTKMVPITPNTWVDVRMYYNYHPLRGLRHGSQFYSGGNYTTEGWSP